jgi:hypothetical protein
MEPPMAKYDHGGGCACGLYKECISPEECSMSIQQWIELQARRKRMIEWQPIETAPKDGTVVTVYVAARDNLPAFITHCAYHPDAGWCADEIRSVTHWMPKSASQFWIGTPDAPP